jgi:hypothetical protein
MNRSFRYHVEEDHLAYVALVAKVPQIDALGKSAGPRKNEVVRKAALQRAPLRGAGYGRGQQAQRQFGAAGLSGGRPFAGATHSTSRDFQTRRHEKCTKFKPCPRAEPHFRPIRAEANRSKKRVLHAPDLNLRYGAMIRLGASLASSPPGSSRNFQAQQSVGAISASRGSGPSR